MSALFEVSDLCVSFGPLEVVSGVFLAVEAGGALGVVGESGSGKSVSALGPWGLLGGATVSGSARFEGQELLGASPEALRSLRGGQVGFVFQDPMAALNPALRVGEQVAEALAIHQRLSASQRRARAIELLARVGVPSPELRVDAWPHELSGGLRQRALIASAMACGPKLLIADEPTTALDVTVQAQVLELLARLRREDGLAVLLISHDLGVVSEFCDRLAVLYAGQVVEVGPTAEVLGAPRHPYTQALLECAPRADAVTLRELPGTVPDPAAFPSGCRFHPRCAFADATCRLTAPASTAANARAFACHHPLGAPR